MIPYLSCDWGTSSFRLSLVDAENFRVIESAGTNKGILPAYNYWIETTNADPAARVAFYLNIIKEQITALEEKTGSSLDGIPLLISGMASSSVGMMPLPYHEIPFFIDGSDILSEYFPETSQFKHDILLISGVSTEDDVMRGEETQLIGMFQEAADFQGDRLFIFPGTHSKHIIVNGKQAVSFKTYMTGEFFDLLSKKSILHAGLEEGDILQAGHPKENFEKAVREGASTKTENYHYLSGLLIGAELGEIVHNDTIEIYLCCGAKLKVHYETALEALGLKKVHSFSAASVEKAAMIGQYKIYEKYIKR